MHYTFIDYAVAVGIGAGIGLPLWIAYCMVAGWRAERDERRFGQHRLH